MSFSPSAISREPAGNGLKTLKKRLKDAVYPQLNRAIARFRGVRHFGEEASFIKDKGVDVGSEI